MRVEVILSGLSGENIENVEGFEVMLLIFAQFFDQILTIFHRKAWNFDYLTPKYPKIANFFCNFVKFIAF